MCESGNLCAWHAFDNTRRYAQAQIVTLSLLVKVLLVKIFTL